MLRAVAGTDDGADGGPLADVGVFCMAGADLPVDDRRLHRRCAACGWPTS